MTNATPGGGAIDTDGDVGVAVGAPGLGWATPVGFTVLVWAGAGVAVETGGVAVGVGVAVVVTAAAALDVGDGDAAGAALRWCVQAVRASSPASTAQHPAREEVTSH
jgi:hypothetical protein